MVSFRCLGRSPVPLPEFDGVRGAGELPSVGAFADVCRDDVVDEVVLELIVGELAGQPEFLDLVPVAPAAVIRSGAARLLPRSRASSPVLTMPLISNCLYLVVGVEGITA
ncbi:hypothetical protein [Streptomyces sp. NPDC002078]